MNRHLQKEQSKIKDSRPVRKTDRLQKPPPLEKEPFFNIESWLTPQKSCSHRYFLTIGNTDLIAI